MLWRIEKEFGPFSRILCWRKVNFFSNLDLVRSGVASIEEELQQRASLLAVDNANLRSLLEQSNTELHGLRSKLTEFEQTQKKLVKMQQQLLLIDKENKKLQQTNNYLQQELVKSGKKFPTDSGSGGIPATPPSKPPAP